MLLKFGSKGDDVKKLQIKLGLGPDGIFGKDTEEAVKSFQTKSGLMPDGIVGEGTWNKMFSSQQLITDPSTPKISNNFNLEKLSTVLPKSIFNLIPESFVKYNINSALRSAHFLGQISHESGNFTIKTESLMYSRSQRIIEIWPTRFNLTGDNNKKNANEFVKNEQKLAESVYGGRMGNNNPGDGFRFRGGGFLQLTGKEAYKGYANYIGKPVEEVADLIRLDNYYALDAALWEFSINMKLNTVADKGIGDDIIKSITKTINGGYIGLQERIKEVKKYYNLLS